MSAKPRLLIEAVIIILASVLPFLPATFSPHFIFDDKPAVENNQVVQGTACNLHQLFNKDFWGEDIRSERSHKSFRPVTSLTYWLQLGSNRIKEAKIARELKAVNLLVNVVNSALLYILTSVYFNNNKEVDKRNEAYQYLPLSATLLFSVHPVHVEAVVSIVGRADLLYTTGFLVTVLFSMTCRPRGYTRVAVKYCAIFVLTAITLLCKEQGILLLPLLLALEIPNFRSRPIKESVLFVVYTCVCTGLLICARLWVIDFKPPTFRREDNPFSFTTGVSRVYSVSYLASLNSLLLVAPCWLCFDWAMGCLPLIHNISDPRILAVMCFFLILAGLFHKGIIQGDLKIFLSLCFIIIPFLLCLNIFVRVGFVVGERNLYLSVAGYSWLYHTGYFRLRRYITSKSQRTRRQLRAMQTLHIIVLVFHTLKSLHRSTEWQNEITLFQSGLKVCPANGKVFYNLAKVTPESDSHRNLTKLLYHESVRLAPDFEHALNNLGNLYRVEGDLKTSVYLLSRAVKINPEFAAAHMNLGVALMKSGQFEEARNHYDRGLELRYPYADCVYNLGILHLKTNSVEEAEQAFRLGVSWEHELSHLNLIILLDNLQRLQEARDVALLGVEKFPLRSDFRFHLANLYGQMEDYTSAEKEYKAALSLEIKSTYLLNLGVLYHRWGKMDSAREAYKNILRIEPGNQKAQMYLARISKRT